jgi:hypothetical protein
MESDDPLGGSEVRKARSILRFLCMRTRILIAGALFYGVVFAVVAVGVMQTVEIIDERRGPPPLGPEDWVVVRTVARVPSDIGHIFSFMAAPMSITECGWFGVGTDRAKLFEPIGIQPDPGFEYIPHVITFEDVPPDSIESADLDVLVEYEEEGLVGLVFFAGEFLRNSPDFTSWSESAIAHLIPVTVAEEGLVADIDAEVRIRDRKFPPFEGFDFRTFRVHTITMVAPKPGARIVATVDVNGKRYPLLVWWEINGARVVVWTGSFDDIFGWMTGEFWKNEGRGGGPSFARRLVLFAAKRRPEEEPIS